MIDWRREEWKSKLMCECESGEWEGLDVAVNGEEVENDVWELNGIIGWENKLRIVVWWMEY